MKKILCMFVLSVFCISLTACTSKEAQSIIDKINDIGEINKDTGEILKEIEVEYNNLSEDDKTQVSNYEEYKNAVKEYDEYMYSKVDDICDDLAYYDYNLRNLYGNDLFTFYDYMSDEQKRESLSLYLFYQEAPDYVEEKIKNGLKSPSSYKLYDMDISSILTYNEETDKYNGTMKIRFGATNSFGAEIQTEKTIWVYFKIDIERQDIYFSDISVW